MRLSQQDHARISAAVTQAERDTAGEIVVIVAPRSDAYHDVGLHMAALAMLAVVLATAWAPGWIGWLHGLIEPWSTAPSTTFLLVALAWAQAAAFLIVRVACAWMPLRMVLTPRGTKARRVRRQATTLFRASAEHRTRAATGVLLYLSLAEHRAEIVADAAIHDRVAPEVWGDVLAPLLVALRAGTPGDGMIAAVGAIGTILTDHFPKGAHDVNELSDRVIEL